MPCYVVPVLIEVFRTIKETLKSHEILLVFSSLVYYLNLQLEAHIRVYMLIHGLRNQLTSLVTYRVCAGKKHIVYYVS